MQFRINETKHNIHTNFNTASSNPKGRLWCNGYGARLEGITAQEGHIKTFAY